jgi:hypothetical protein
VRSGVTSTSGGGGIMPDRQFGLPDAGFVGGILGVRARCFAVSFALIPPLDEIASLGVGFVFCVDEDVIAADAALAVKQGGGEGPLVVDLNLLETFDSWQSWHKAILGRTASRIAYKPAKCKQTKNAHDREAF